MKDADAVIVADIPFGEANIRNLDGLEHVKGELYIHKNILNQDFTHGQLQRRLDEIQKIKEIHFYENSTPGTGCKLRNAALPTIFSWAK